jgi:hypothetical protein
MNEQGCLILLSLYGILHYILFDAFPRRPLHSLYYIISLYISESTRYYYNIEQKRLQRDCSDMPSV